MNIYGEYNADGSVKVWPDTDINGNPYSRPPAATCDIPGDRFLVLPAGFNDPEAITRLTHASKPTRSRKDDADDNE